MKNKQDITVNIAVTEGCAFGFTGGKDNCRRIE